MTEADAVQQEQPQKPLVLMGVHRSPKGYALRDFLHRSNIPSIATRTFWKPMCPAFLPPAMFGMDQLSAARPLSAREPWPLLSSIVI